MSQRQSKIVWAEGLFLGQQHFQQWDKVARHELQQRTRLLNPHCWGIIDLRMDNEALANSQCRVTAVSAVMPSGQRIVFDAGQDGGPLICDLPPSHSQVEVWLALPDNDHVEGINGYQDQGRLCGWRARYHTVADEHDPSRTREVIVAKPNLSLVRAQESREDFSALCIGRFEHLGDGHFQPLADFIPAVVNTEASAVLSGWMTRVRDLLAARVRQLAQQRNSYGDLADMGSRELGQFLRLLQLRPALLSLEHLIEQGSAHPLSLYQEMLRLIASLRDFQPDLPELQLPDYRHTGLTEVFQQLEQLLRESLAESAKTPSTALTLQTESPALRLAEGVPWGALDSSHLYLGVYFDSEDPAWVTEFAKQAKCGSRADLELILASALPGIRLSHTQRPPNRLPVKSGFEYFRFEPSGEFWPRAMEAQSLALFLPSQFHTARFELLCVED